MTIFWRGDPSNKMRRCPGIVEGVFLPQSIKENISIEKWDEWAGPLGIMNEKKIEEVVNEWVEKLRIKLHDINDPMNTLSGGNQQKCVLAKWLILDLNVLILNGPTVGVDIGAKGEIYSLIRDITAQGKGVIVLGDTLDECIGLSNRLLVMKDGEITKELDASADHKPEQVDIVKYMM